MPTHPSAPDLMTTVWWPPIESHLRDTAHCRGWLDWFPCFSHLFPGHVVVGTQDVERTRDRSLPTGWEGAERKRSQLAKYVIDYPVFFLTPCALKSP